MNDATDSISPEDGGGTYPEQQGTELGGGERRRRWLRVGAVVGGVMMVALGAVWLTRERIADNIIAGQLRQMGLPGTYRIVSIGPREQVLADIVIGDPRRPDLTIRRVVIAIGPRLGFPVIERVMLVGPRLSGEVRNGELTFGSLDKVLFAQGSRREPFRLPELDLAVVDGRADLSGELGAVDIRFAGEGPLRGGFAGNLAAAAPLLRFGECTVRDAALNGRIVVSAESPRFAGPLRVNAASCPGGVGLRRAEMGIDARADRSLEGGEARLILATGALGSDAAKASGLNGRMSASVRNGLVSARYDLLARGLDSAALSAATLGAKGTLRARDGLSRAEVEAALDGGGVRLGDGANAALVGFEQVTAGSLVAPLLRQMREALVREGRASRLVADVIARRTAGRVHVVVPQGRLTGGSGATLLTLSRVQYTSGEEGRASRLAGNFVTGGAGLPHFSGRMEKGAGGDTIVTMAMAEYRAGAARVAIPRLVVAQTTNGALGFSGTAVASGPLPGGRAENLVVPIEGGRSPRGALNLWRRCATVRFDALAYADLALENRALLLCPGPGGAIVRSDASGTRIAVGAPSLDLAGRLGQTPIRIASGPVGFALPGTLFARDLDVALGPADAPTRFRLADLRADVRREIAGTFAGTDVRLFSVPLDLLDAAGTWRIANGRLDIADGTFRLEDRAAVDRFQPLTAQGGQLSLVDNRIIAKALLREPATSREVLNVTVEHDLADGRGRAGLAMDGLVFDRALQPDMLSRQLLGVVANAVGTVRGAGRIDWTARGVTSSGRFGTESLDFAAAFGPVKRVSGAVEFSDLVNFVTPPGQKLRIGSINPGIEVLDGEMRFQLQPASRLAIEGGSWPFLGGTLRLQPVDLNLGVAETRRYVLDIEGLDAARFVSQMELANISATGTFDGSLPLVFDENGGRVEGGVLTSRPPGGNVSYVGALTWKDLSPIANFAFDALKSLDYRTMRIAMDGALEGNIVTRVRFDGVKQGEGAKRNFLTRRFASLPLQFNVNIRAPFYQLITSFKSIYDPAYVKDPRTLGLIDSAGRPMPTRAAGSAAPIQPPVSGNAP